LIPLDHFNGDRCTDRCYRFDAGRERMDDHHDDGDQSRSGDDQSDIEAFVLAATILVAAISAIVILII
jgi:hypothetical protein